MEILFVKYVFFSQSLPVNFISMLHQKLIVIIKLNIIKITCFFTTV